MRGERLADGADVVLLALNGQKKCFLDRAEVDGFALVLHFPERQQIALEYLIDGFEIEVRAHVHDREIFLVEVADRIRLLDVAGDAMMEEVDEGLRVPLGVHAHERAELKKSRINAPSATLELGRHGSDHVGAEPFDRLLLGEFVDLGRRDARVDRDRPSEVRLAGWIPLRSRAMTAVAASAETVG